MLAINELCAPLNKLELRLICEKYFFSPGFFIYIVHVHLHPALLRSLAKFMITIPENWIPFIRVVKAVVV
jgi:hypothetical protein